jgi:hypothetical protein
MKLNFLQLHLSLRQRTHSQRDRIMMLGGKVEEICEIESHNPRQQAEREDEGETSPPADASDRLDQKGLGFEITGKLLGDTLVDSESDTSGK